MKSCDEMVTVMPQNSGKPQRNVEFNDVQSDSNLGLLRTQGALDTDKLLSLFHGSRDNVDYFIGLWDVVKCFGDCECKSYSCDPRDESKRHHNRDWRPKARVCLADLASTDGQTDLVETDGVFATKQVVLDHGDGQGRNTDLSQTKADCDADKESFRCGVHGCGQVLSSLASYESHYHHCHNFVCATCRRVCVSAFLLDIHLQENHDSYFAILSPRIDMYRCLVESCEEKFRTPEWRKEHMVSCHQFPPSFSFHQPVREHRSKQVHGSSASMPVSMEINSSSMSGELEENTVAMDTGTPNRHDDDDDSKKKKKNTRQHRNRITQEEKRVPPTICFGRGSQRAFQRRRDGGGRGRNWYQTNAAMERETTVDIEAVDMQELAEALT